MGERAECGGRCAQTPGRGAGFGTQTWDSAPALNSSRVKTLSRFFLSSGSAHRKTHSKGILGETSQTSSRATVGTPGSQLRRTGRLLSWVAGRALKVTGGRARPPGFAGSPSPARRGRWAGEVRWPRAGSGPALGTAPAGRVGRVNAAAAQPADAPTTLPVLIHAGGARAAGRPAAQIQE